MAPRMWPESLVIDIRKERDEALRERDYNLSVIKQRNAMLTEAQKERDALSAKAEKLQVERDTEASIINRIWKQLGSPTYAELKGRSIYDLIDELKADAAKLEQARELLRSCLNTLEWDYRNESIVQSADVFLKIK
jgi:hypothetical protein